MARRKMKKATSAKGKKTVTKRSKVTNLSLAANLAKDFRATPAKIAALYNKELAVFGQQSNKLIKALKKAEAKQTAAKNKQDKLTAKANPAKKQLTAAKKAVEACTKVVNSLTAELDQVKKQVSSLSQKASTFTTLGKELIKLEKQLEAKAKIAAQPKAKAPKKAKSAKPAETSASQSELIEQETHHEEAPETASTEDFFEVES